MEHIVIIGNGISGITAARHIRKLSDKTITVISAETDYFFSRTALMYIFMGHMNYEHTKPYEDFFWEKNRIDLVRGFVEKIDSKNKSLSLQDGSSIKYDKLILGVGSTPNRFGWKGQELDGVQSLYSYQDLELMEENTINAKKAVIVGGGLIGVEMAEMLRSRNIDVTFLVMEEWFWGNVLPIDEGKMISAHIKEHHVELKTQTMLKEIVPDENGRVKHIITDKDEIIECQFVGLTAGVRANIDFMKDGEIATNRGVLVNEFLETNIPDIYALGDCAEFHEHPVKGRRNTEQVWYTGRMMGETLAQSICGNKTAYKPTTWFNSAKFFDIEYQTYGWVWNKLKENENQFYWQCPSNKKCLHIVFDKETRQVLGINVFGIRLRHEVCVKWIEEKRTVTYAVEHLKDANFDPEFFIKHEEAIASKYNKENGTSLKVKKRSWKRIFVKD